MIVLDTVNRYLDVVLSAPVTTSQLHIVASYLSSANSSSDVSLSQDSQTKNTTPVIIVQSPIAGGYKIVNFISIKNNDSVAANVTVRFVDGTTIKELISISLDPDDTLTYDSSTGFSVTNSFGQQKIAIISGVGGFGTISSTGKDSVIAPSVNSVLNIEVANGLIIATNNSNQTISLSIAQDINATFTSDWTELTGGDETILHSHPSIVPGSALISGGDVIHIVNYDFLVTAAVYIINGTQYNSPQTNVTLSAANATFDRFDVIAVDTSNTVVVLQGTPSVSPVIPTIDPSTQLQLTIIPVPAGSSGPVGVANVDIYLENTEWTSSVTAHINPASTNNPYAGNVDIEATSAVAGNYIELTNPSGLIDLSQYSNLIFRIRLKSSWPSSKYLAITWRNGGSIIGTSLSVKNGFFGLNNSVTGVYQQIVMPISSFNVTSNVNKIRIQVAGGSSSIGWYIDNIVLQGGISSPPTGGASSPGSPATSVQFNRGGVFGGNANFTYDESGIKLIIGNNAVNSTIQPTLIQVVNSTSIANLEPTQLLIGSSVVNSTTIAEGANVILSTSKILVGNSSENSSIQSTLIQVANSTSIANLDPLRLVIGTSKVNSTMFAVGSNVLVNTSALFIGNSSQNSTLNASNLVLADANVEIDFNSGVDVLNNSRFLIHSITDNANGGSICLDNYGANATQSTAGNFQARVGRGTRASPSALQAGDIGWIGSFKPYGTTGFANNRSASIVMYASENQSDSAHGTYIVIETTANTTNTLTEALRIGGDHFLTVNGASVFYPIAGNTLVKAQINIVANDLYLSLLSTTSGISSPALVLGDNNTPVRFIMALATNTAYFSNVTLANDISLTARSPGASLILGARNTGGLIRFTTGANPDIERMSISNSAVNINTNMTIFIGNSTVNSYCNATNLAITNSTYQAGFFISGTTGYSLASGSGSTWRQDVYATAPAGNWQVRSARGTSAAPANLVADDVGAIISFIPYGSTAFASVRRAAITMRIAENANDTVQGTYITFETTNNQTTTTVESLRIGNDKSLIVNGNIIIGNTDTTKGNILIGNSTVNALANSTLIKVSNSTSTANLDPIKLVIGTSTVNSTTISEGANIVLTTTTISAGNSTINTSVNSTSFYINADDITQRYAHSLLLMGV